MTFTEIEEITGEYARARGELSQAMNALESEISKIKKQHLPKIKRLVEKTAERKSLLISAIGENLGLFARPRTQTFHGVKVGIQKGKGKIVIEDEDKTIKLLRKLRPDDAEVYIDYVEKLSKSALSSLTASELRKVGIDVEETGDVVVVRPMDSDIEKLVDALLKGDEKEIKEAA